MQPQLQATATEGLVAIGSVQSGSSLFSGPATGPGNTTQVEQVIKQSAADVVFDYRNVLLKGWADTPSVGLPSASLPAPFANFKQLVKAVMDAQAPVKKSTQSKTQVCPSYFVASCLSLFGITNTCFRLSNVLVAFTNLELL